MLSFLGINILNEIKQTLYEKVSSSILTQIENGTFPPGGRLPSVRQLSEQNKISVTTILQAYRILEDRGIIEARPQSGYYVRISPLASVEPELTSPPLDPTHVSVADLSLFILHDSQNPKLIQFGTAIPAPELLPTTKLNHILSQAIHRKDIPFNTLGTPEGWVGLRHQVARRAFVYGCTLSPDDIIITTGCMEAISLSLRAICKPGDLVAIESPSYFGILQALEAQGLRALEIPTHAHSGISLNALRFALEHHPIRACIVISNYNNPLGSCMPDENKRDLVEMLANANVPLIEDDIYGELAFSGQHPSVAKSYDTKGLVLLCSSFTKDISPSFRVGWVAPGRYKHEIELQKMALNISSTLLPQVAIAEFLENGGYDYHLRKIRRAYAQKVTQMERAIQKYFPESSQVSNPSGGFLLWVRLPENVDSLILYKEALYEGITLAPGYLFSTTDKYRNYIRLNAAYWSYTAEKALEQLGILVYNLSERKKLK